MARHHSCPGTTRRYRWFRCDARRAPPVSLGSRAAVGFALAALLPGCKPPPEQRYFAEPGAAARGLAAIERAGCAACHRIEGVAWPQGRLGPSLLDYDDAGLIAGALPNTPANLAAFVANAPAAKPGSPMPPMPLTPAEARDVATYLMGTTHD